MAVGIGAVDLGQGGMGPAPDLGFADAEEVCDVAVALATREQKLQQRPAVLAQGHGG